MRRHGYQALSGEGFERHAAEPATVPPTLDVGYVDPSGDGRDDVFNLHTITTAHLKTSEYRTHDGPRTAARIDAQLHCHAGT
ncbi:hypothetical protein OG762_35110 [Streptomyces sp. NBC_01136]|uniref:hypothetical protein n=1 Tax=unclassified Streptomyces TaxID=2593676 RepID=UPI003246D348|nr:hypothetical protein OG762_35110 [Streptomyces sp. NBC_01136]